DRVAYPRREVRQRLRSTPATALCLANVGHLIFGRRLHASAWGANERKALCITSGRSFCHQGYAPVFLLMAVWKALDGSIYEVFLNRFAQNPKDWQIRVDVHDLVCFQVTKSSHD